MHNEVPGWGSEQWGYAKLGLRPTTGGPLVIYTEPSNGQLDVLEDTFITVQFFDPTYDLDTTHSAISVNGVLAYVGATGFSAGYIGTVSYAAGVSTVRVRNTAGYAFDQVVNVSAHTQDLTGLSVTRNWIFQIRANPIAYSGLNPLPIETALLLPFENALSLEPYRILLLDNALRLSPALVNNRSQKAARVIYKIAFATELSTLQNIHDLRNQDALATVVVEKQNTRVLDKIIAENTKSLKADIQAFHKMSGLDPAYLTVFNDYLDSTLYTYRVSLLANILLYAKANELTQG